MCFTLLSMPLFLEILFATLLQCLSQVKVLSMVIPKNSALSSWLSLTPSRYTSMCSWSGGNDFFLNMTILVLFAFSLSWFALKKSLMCSNSLVRDLVRSARSLPVVMRFESSAKETHFRFAAEGKSLI